MKGDNLWQREWRAHETRCRLRNARRRGHRTAVVSDATARALLTLPSREAELLLENWFAGVRTQYRMSRAPYPGAPAPIVAGPHCRPYFTRR